MTFVWPQNFCQQSSFDWDLGLGSFWSLASPDLIYSFISPLQLFFLLQWMYDKLWFCLKNVFLSHVASDDVYELSQVSLLQCAEIDKNVGCSEAGHAGYWNRKPLTAPEYFFANGLMAALFHVWRKQPSSVLFLHKEVKINAERVINLWTMSAAQDVCLALNFTLMLPERLRYRSLTLWLHRVFQSSGLYFIRHDIPCPFSEDTHVQDKDIGRIFIRTARSRGCELQQREPVYLQKCPWGGCSFKGSPEASARPLQWVTVLRRAIILCVWRLLARSEIALVIPRTSGLRPFASCWEKTVWSPAWKNSETFSKRENDIFMQILLLIMFFIFPYSLWFVVETARKYF